MPETLPALPEGYLWQLCQGDRDITSEFFGVDDADEARIWTEPGDLVLVLEHRDGEWLVGEANGREPYGLTLGALHRSLGSVVKGMRLPEFPS